MSLKILHLLDHSTPLHSGYAFRTLAILNEQHRLGWETVHLTTPKHYIAQADVETASGLTFYRTRPPATALRRLPVANQVMVVRDTARRLREVIAETRPDVLHAHSPALNGLAALSVGRELGLPVVYEMRASWEDAAVDHGTTRSGSLRYRLSRLLETRVLRRAAAVTTICEGLRSDILIRGGIEPDKVTLIPNAVNLDDFPPIGGVDSQLRAQLGLSGGGPVIGFIGSFYAYEGLDLLLAAVPEILEAHDNLRVILVGGGPVEDALRAKTNAMGLQSKVHFIGRVPHAEVNRYYSLIDVLVYARHATRLTETVTPLKPLEAMAQGRLFVASNVGGHREIVPPQLHDHLFAAGDIRALARSVLGLLDDPQSWAQRAQAGHAYVERERTWKHSVARYSDVYARVLDPRKV